MRRLPVLALVVSALAIAAQPASAQPAPFDMSPERPQTRTPETRTPETRTRETLTPAAPPAPAPVRPAPPAARPVAPPAAQPPAGAPQATSPSAPAAPASPTVAAPDAAQAAPSSDIWRRYLIAGTELTLAGEIDRRRWSVYLTREEADAAATLRLGYQNTILAAPEASHLRVFVNDAPLIEERVSSSSGMRDLSASVPGGLLRPGFNTITVETNLRHRTDCSIQSTYDLWTEIASERTFLEFAGAPSAFGPRRLEDLRAVGLDAQGRTRFRLLMPETRDLEATRAVLRLSQALSIIAGMPNLGVEIVQGAVPAAAPGVLDVALGPASDLAGFVPNIPNVAGPGGNTGFTARADGTTMLLVSGGRWEDVTNGVERIVAFADRPDAPLRPAISNPALRTPDAPLLREGGTISFRDLGVPSQEFAGRRFRTEFAIAVPGDFFAESYGEALLRLDAAYSGEVRPGSQINVYVNGNIATTLPIGGGGSGILDAFPLKMTMRHLRPGANTIAMEVTLQTEADAACLPGATASGAGRFAIFDTSRIDIPAFARIARVPDLSAMQGVGFPYNRATAPVSVVIGDDRPTELAHAASFLGRLSFVGNRAIPIELPGSQPSAISGHAIFIGTPRQLPANVLAQVNVDPIETARWGGQTPAADPSGGLTLENWRDQFANDDGWGTVFTRIGAWLRSTFDIEDRGLRLLPAPDQPISPAPDATLLVSQGEGPTDGSVWTLVSAPTPAALDQGIDALVRETNWVQLSGRATTLDGTGGTFSSQPVGSATFLPTQPWTIANARLILANWLSENVLSYATLIVLVALVLGLSTTAFVRSLGQR